MFVVCLFSSLEDELSMALRLYWVTDVLFAVACYLIAFVSTSSLQPRSALDTSLYECLYDLCLCLLVHVRLMERNWRTSARGMVPDALFCCCALSHPICVDVIPPASSQPSSQPSSQQSSQLSGQTSTLLSKQLYYGSTRCDSPSTSCPIAWLWTQTSNANSN